MATSRAEMDTRERMKNRELLQSGINTSISEQGAMERQKVQGKQAQLLENLKNQASFALENMKQQEESKRKAKELQNQLDKQKINDYFTMTPSLVAGLKKTTGLDFKDIQGQRVRSDITIATIVGNAKIDYAKIHATAKGKTPEDLNKELRQVQGAIKGNRDKLMMLTAKDLPAEAWGGEPGNVTKAIQYISAGNFGNLDPNQKSQIQLVAGYINTMRAQQNRANELHKALEKQPEDYTGMGLGGGENTAKTYKSADEVKAAFQAGQIDRAAAKKILADLFNIK
jgi:hypothetical protein